MHILKEKCLFDTFWFVLFPKEYSRTLKILKFIQLFIIIIIHHAGCRNVY